MKKLLKLTLITGIILSLLSLGTISASASCPLTSLLTGSGSGSNMFGSLFGNSGNNNNIFSSLFGSNSNIFGTNTNTAANTCNTNTTVTNTCNTNNANTCNGLTNTCTTNTCNTQSATPPPTDSNQNCYNGVCVTECTNGSCDDDDYTDDRYEFELKKGYTYSLKVSSYATANLIVESSDTSVVTARLRAVYSDGTAIVYLKALNAGCAEVIICPANNPSLCETVYVCVTDGRQQTSGQNSQNNNTNANTAQDCDNFAQDVLKYVNEARASGGLSALKLDSALCNAAKVRAAEVKVKFSHTRPDGTSCFTVLRDFNISYNLCGENIAIGYTDAKSVVNAWMNSSSHRANIMNPNYKFMGLGKDGTGWAQLFTG